jgi:hypothetical protein
VDAGADDGVWEGDGVQALAGPAIKDVYPGGTITRPGVVVVFVDTFGKKDLLSSTVLDYRYERLESVFSPRVQVLLRSPHSFF